MSIVTYLHVLTYISSFGAIMLACARRWPPVALILQPKLNANTKQLDLVRAHARRSCIMWQSCDDWLPGCV